MEEYQMELLTLNKFIINGQLCERGIIQFLANGQLGDFDINVKKTNILIDVPAEEQESKSEVKDAFEELKLRPVSRKTWSQKGLKRTPIKNPFLESNEQDISENSTTEHREDHSKLILR